MEYYFILARSVTHAQRIQRVLIKAGVRCQIDRAPRDITEQGCAYTVRLPRGELTTALVALGRERMDPVRIYLYQSGAYREVLS